MNRRARPLAAALLIAGAVTGPFALSGTSAADSTFDGQYNLSAAAHGLSITFGNPASQPYPLVAGQLPETQSTLNTGPTSHALASALWPGPLAADAGSLAGLVLPACSPPNAGPVDIPVVVCTPAPRDLPVPVSFANYPVRAETQFPGGKDSDVLGPLSSKATGDSSEAATTVTDFASGSVVSAARMSVHTRTFETGGKLTAMGESVITGLNLGNGAITIDSLKTVATSTTDGKESSSSRTVTIKGLKVQDRGASVDQTGVHFNGADANPAAAVQDGANAQLKQGGMELFLTKPVEDKRSATEARSSSTSLAFVWVLDGANRVVLTVGGAEANVQAIPGLDLSLLGIDDIVDDASIADSSPSALDSAGDTGVLGSVVGNDGSAGTSAGVLGSTSPAVGRGAPTANLDAAQPAGFIRRAPSGALIFALLCVALAASLLRRGQLAAAATIAAERSVCPNDRRDS